jgi:uncharacterized iron-regulated protein
MFFFISKGKQTHLIFIFDMDVTIKNRFNESKKSAQQVFNRNIKKSILFIFLVWQTACCQYSKKPHVTELSMSFDSGTIVSSDIKKPITLEALMNDLQAVQIIYVGEQHTNPDHHAIQLKILENLCQTSPGLIVGMEMFDRTYQPILDQWSAGMLTDQEFIEKVHWYANWKYDFDFYAGILTFIKDHRIPLFALNVPSDISAKIAVGGLENLRPWERQYLPKIINTSNLAHKSYVENIFNLHHAKGRENFEFFYAAQCIWEDAMAQSIADNLGNNSMIVFAGNGHIIQKFGIPDRAYSLTGASFKTIMPISTGSDVDFDDADYLWVTLP